MEINIANKASAVQFLEMITMGKIDEAYEEYVDMNGTHHNAYTAAGMSALKEGMKGAWEKFPNMKRTTHHVLGDEPFVAVHSRMTLEKDTLDFASLHLFRFENGKIAELWDLSQAITNDSPNTDGVF